MTDRVIKGKLFERKRCSNPNCQSENLRLINRPTEIDPLGEKFCPDCRTTQTWGKFVKDKDQEPECKSKSKLIKNPKKDSSKIVPIENSKQDIETEDDPPKTIESIEDQKQKASDWYDKVLTIPDSGHEEP